MLLTKSRKLPFNIPLQHVQMAYKPQRILVHPYLGF